MRLGSIFVITNRSGLVRAQILNSLDANPQVLLGNQ
jgi:hypothetical protein